MDKTEFKITSDGSHTLYIPRLDETYHSTHGAIQEAKHVFIEAGLNFINLPNCSILEIGFGTGLNAYLSLLEADRNKIAIKYMAIEAFPLQNEIIKELNYLKELQSNKEEKAFFKQLHDIDWGNNYPITQYFQLKKVLVELEKLTLQDKFDIIYFDAFGPRVQPEMWTKEVFIKMYNYLNKDGFLVTYCAKGSVKRTLKEVGFKVESLPGPPGKREMTRAKKL